MSENLYGEEHKMEIRRLQKMMNNMTCGQMEKPLSIQDFKFQETPLGKGAFGTVFLVRNSQDGKEYALKRVMFSSSQHGIPQSVLREITTMKRLSRKAHPNIISLKAVFHQVNHLSGLLTINMVMEKCDWDLHTFLHKIDRKVPEKQARHMTVQIVRGLDFLHTHNIIHRDLKPQNILVNRDQSVKIADFGLAKEYSNTTAFTTVVVTLWYRSPEVLLKSYYNSTVDMWALGCIVSEIFSREALFTGRNEADQLADIFKKMGTPEVWPSEAVITKDSFPCYQAQAMRELNPCLSDFGADFVRQCLRYDPMERLSARAAVCHPFLMTRVNFSRVLKPLHFNN